MRIHVDCVSGPRPPRSGDRPLERRRLELDGARVRRILHFTVPPDLVRSGELEAQTLEGLLTLAEAALEAGPQPAEVPVPDGTLCQVEIDDGSRSLVLELTSPTRHGELQPLLEALMAELPDPDRPEAERDPALEELDQSCRHHVAEHGIAVEAFTLVEVRIDPEQQRFLYYQKLPTQGETVVSSDDHFACRVDSAGEILWLPEG